MSRTACTRDCPDACGIVATVEDGRVVRLQVDPHHPVTRGFLCYRTSRFLERQYAPDLIKDRDIVRISRFFPLWVVVSLLLPAVIGGLWTMSLAGALTAFFWASLVRVSLLHHVTWSINSICHTVGERPFKSRDKSGNVWWLAIPSMGESWHNLHHADPTCARHGVLRGQVDTSARIIWLMQKFGWVSDVRWPVAERLEKRRVDAAARKVGEPREEGAMEGVDYVIAQHVDPLKPVGTISINAGPSSGGVDSWHAVIKGKGGHGAHPDKTVDPFYLMAHVIIALNAIISRRINPFEPAVVSIGSISGGFTENVIPETVKITGTLRYTNEKVHQQIHMEIERAFDIVKALGGDYEIRYDIGGPPMINDEFVSDMIEKTGRDLLGDSNVGEIEKTLGAEDFGEFMKHAPGAMYTLGVQKEGHEGFLLHHPKFDLDESALPIGTAMLAETAKRFLLDS